MYELLQVTRVFFLLQIVTNVRAQSSSCPNVGLYSRSVYIDFFHLDSTVGPQCKILKLSLKFEFRKKNIYNLGSIFKVTSTPLDLMFLKQ
jgi:hypothetical protein